jgi:hypothetical protein
MPVLGDATSCSRLPCSRIGCFALFFLALVHGYRAPFGRRPWIRLGGLTSSRHDLA